MPAKEQNVQQIDGGTRKKAKKRNNNGNKK